MAKNNTRGQNEGSIRQRKDGIWESRYTAGKDANGRQIQRSIYGKTKAEVKEKLTKVLHELSSGTYIEPSKITLREWLETWFKEYVSNSVKLSTKASYELYIDKHINPIIGHIQLKDLKTDSLQRFYNEKLSNGRLDGEGGLNPKTIKNMHNMLHSALEQALKNGLIMRNISESAVLPKAKKKEMRVLSPGEQKKLQEVVQDERLGMAIILDLATGLRLGELLALQWNDIDLKAGVLTVKRTINWLKSYDPDSKQKTSIVIGEPKTKHSNRQIRLQNIILKKLIAYSISQKKEKLASSDIYADTGYVFTNTTGKPIEPRTFQDFFYKMIKKAEIQSANFHCLRHTFATRALEAGIPAKTVSEILGHSNIGTTLDLYSHVSLELKKQSMERLSNLFETINNDDEKMPFKNV